METEVVITKEILEKGKSVNNGFNTQQITILGETQKEKGWYRRLLGKKVSPSQIEQFFALKNAHIGKSRQELILQNKQRKQKHLVSFVYVQPGTLSFKDQYLHPNWQRLRAIVLKRDSYRCVNCKSMDKTLHAHHLKYSRNGFVWEVPHWYIVTLCDACHSEEHGRDLSAK